MNAALRRALTTVAIAAAALGVTVVPAQAAPLPPPTITSVTFDGFSGTFNNSPRVVIKGSGFGAKPTGTTANTCNPSQTDNGQNYGNKLYFVSSGKFTAGFSNGAGANCVGIDIQFWSATRVTLTFGADSYGNFDNYDIANGDGYAVSVKQTIWGGTVSGLT